VIDYIEQLVNQRTSYTETLKNMYDLAAAEGRVLTESEEAIKLDLEQRCEALDPKIKDTNAQLSSARAFAELTAGIEKHREHGLEARKPAGQVELTSWGQRFVDSDQFRSYAGHGQSGRYEIEGYLETRAAITTANLYIPHFVLPPVEYQTTAPLLEVCGRVTVSTGVVDWVEIGGDPMAAVVPEGTAKPEAAFTVTPKTAALETLAHWVQITRQALEDASYIKSLIESKLRRGLINKAESSMAAAIDAAITQTAVNADLLAAIRVGIGKVEAAGFNPNAIVLNPADYALLDVSVMGVTTAGPVQNSSIWGLRTVAAAAIPAGKAYVGDFQSGATLFDRGVTNVFLSDSHASLFISNILVILAEARLKSAVTEPNAICECATA
jgi:HK97 family phage major capsid protein